MRGSHWPLLLTVATAFFGLNAFLGDSQSALSRVLFYLLLVLLILSVVFTQGSEDESVDRS